MAAHNEFGKKGEDAAVAFLEGKGYTIIARNSKIEKTEIDIIAQYGNEIVFVEVKSRQSTDEHEAIAAVNQKRMKRLVAAADSYLQQQHTDKSPRFDIIVVFPAGEKLDVLHIADAFGDYVD